MEKYTLSIATLNPNFLRRYLPRKKKTIIPSAVWLIMLMCLLIEGIRTLNHMQ